jgi:hypothetical protein
MATPVMGVLVTSGEPAVGPPGHEPAASAAAWTKAVPMFGKALDAPGWFEYVLQRLTLMLVILGVGAEEVCKCNSSLEALWKMVLEHVRYVTMNTRMFLLYYTNGWEKVELGV